VTIHRPSLVKSGVPLPRRDAETLPTGDSFVYVATDGDPEIRK